MNGEVGSRGRTLVSWIAPALLLLGALAALPAAASSHREAPGTLEMPQVDGADFYMFRSYEAGRDGFVTLVATYNPMQDPFGAPNFFPLRENGFYDIHIDNDSDAHEDLTFRFRFTNLLANGGVGLGVPVPLGPIPPGIFVPVAFSNVFPAGPGSPPPVGGAPPNNQRINWSRTFTARLVRHDDGGATEFLTNVESGGARFSMPFDYVGTRSFPNYEAYAGQFVYDVHIPGCGDGRLFVGQRKDPFVFNLGDFFDLVHIPNIVGDPAAVPSSLADKNITALELEVPISCLTAGGGGSGIIGGWTTASLPRVRTLVDNPTFDQPYVESGPQVQVSRLGNPMVNEVNVALKDKNLFNASHPSEDHDHFQVYFTHSTVPVAIQLVTTLFPLGGSVIVLPPTKIPRNDLVAFYLNGLPGINQDNSGGDVLRLNTNTAAKPAAQQNRLGILGGDNAGWPNGRRPGDDVIDITMRVLEGALCYQAFDLCSPADAPFGALPYTDQSLVQATDFDNAFPYLLTPLPGGSNP